MTAMRVLIGSPVRQDPLVLAEFLASLDRLTKLSFEAHFAFVDDNTDPVSGALLHTFAKTHPTTLLPSSTVPVGDYARNAYTHQWTDSAIWKVASFKDRILAIGRNDSYDHVFLVDSDIILHPFTVEQLLRAKKAIVSCIFWTSWQPGTRPMPQVWVSDEYTLFRKGNRENVAPQEVETRTETFFAQLMRPGTYEVGGLGACTLISRLALQIGVCFKEIPNLSFWGEDRHFCIRAAALGLGLFVDTHLPALHVYRDTELAHVGGYSALSDDMISRFVRVADAHVTSVLWPLPEPWWSRGREYAWAQRFVSKRHVVLDAACGVSHPFKFWLAENAQECHACDLDPRIVDDQAMVANVREDLGGEASIPKNLYRKIADITSLPYPSNGFDRIFCISVLEHMTVGSILNALSEFHRVLKPTGLAVLTFDVPPLDPESIAETVRSVGFEFAGPLDLALPEDALFTHMYGGLRCFRTVLKRRST